MREDQTGATEAGAIAAIAVAGARPAAQIINTPDGRRFLVTDGADVEFTEVTDPNDLTPLPDHIRQGVTVQTLDSLIEYVNRFRTSDTLLFADMASNRIVGAIDYHSPEKAQRFAHTVIMDLPHSEEWKLWTGIDGKLMTQLEFARFLEENAADIETPSAADLLEAIQDIRSIRKADFRQEIRTSLENESFEYVVENDVSNAKGLEVPRKFGLRLPVYFGGQTVSLYALLRYSIDDGKLALGVKLHRKEYVRQAEFKQIVLDAAGRTERTAMFGKASQA